jgi:hypothetical protein
MSQRSSAVTIILVSSIIITLVLAAGGFYLFQKEKLRTQELEVRIEDLNKKQAAAENELQNSKRQITQFQLKLDESKGQIQSLSADLELQKKDSQESQARLEQVKIDLAEQKQLRQDLEKKLGIAQDEIRRAMVQIKDMDSQKGLLEAKVKELESKSQEVELGKIVVTPDGSSMQQGKDEYAPASPVEKTPKGTQILGLQGKVLVVNKEYSFAVINLGAKDGVDVADEFSIFHDNKYLGEVKIEKVHDSMAAAGFLDSGMKDKVSEGDLVIQKVR